MHLHATEEYPGIGSFTVWIRGGSHRYELASRSHTSSSKPVSHELFSVWLSCLLAFLLGLPSLGSSVAFSAATSITTIGLYISYGASFSHCAAQPERTVNLFAAIPIALRVFYNGNFVRGPFHLGRFSLPVASIAVIWTCFISIVFVLPQLNPVDSQTLNYAIVAVGIVITYSVGFWLVSARKWFKGPVKQIEQEGMGVDVQMDEKRGSVEKE